MDNGSIEALLEEAQKLFERRPSTVEPGLDVDTAELLQLRKACRLIRAATHLDGVNGYYTVIIESSFAAIERTLQFHLLDNGFLSPDEYIDHQTVYDRSHEAGLYNKAFRDRLVTLWRNNRSRSYYREGVGSEARAEKMLALATAIHSHVLQLGGRSHECVCGTVQ